MKLRSATAAPKPEPADEEMPLAPPAADLDPDLDPDPEAQHSSDDYVPPGASSAKKRKAKKSNDQERSPETPQQPTISKRKTPKQVKGKAKAKQVERDDSPFPLLKLPGELIDLILADDDLHLGSHLALAATCKVLRACYYSRRPRPATLIGFHSPTWGALLAARPFTGEGSNHWRKADVGVELPDEPERIVKHLWTRKDRVEVGKMVVVSAKAAVRAYEWDVAVHKVATQRITKTTAKSAYKLNDAQLNALSPVYKRNPHGRSAAPMQLFVEAAVEALAFRLHGGAAGHAELLKKRAATEAKARATRRAKAYGTWVSPAKKRKAAAESDDDDSSDDSAGGEGDYGASASLSPSLSPTLTTQRGQASASASGAGASPSKSVAAALAQLSTASPVKARGASSSSGPAPLALGPPFALQPAIPDALSLLGQPSQQLATAADPPSRPHEPMPAPPTSSLDPAAPATASTSTSARPTLSVSSIPNLTDAEREIVLRLLRGGEKGGE